MKDDLTARINEILKARWDVREGKVVPEVADLSLKNEAVKMYGVVLYADLKDSTTLVDVQGSLFAAEVYKAYLHCAGTIIRNEGGVITAYDGDRVMAVFIDGAKHTAAARAALKINYVVSKQLNPLFQAQYPKRIFAIRHTIGIDACEMHVTRTGIWGANDLVWVGRAANYAAKLSALDEGVNIYITDVVYDEMLDKTRISADGKNMWTERTWNKMNDMRIYGSNWTWHPDYSV